MNVHARPPGDRKETTVFLTFACKTTILHASKGIGESCWKRYKQIDK